MWFPVYYVMDHSTQKHKITPFNNSVVVELNEFKSCEYQHKTNKKKLKAF